MYLLGTLLIACCCSAACCRRFLQELHLQPGRWWSRPGCHCPGHHSSVQLRPREARLSSSSPLQFACAAGAVSYLLLRATPPLAAVSTANPAAPAQPAVDAWVISALCSEVLAGGVLVVAEGAASSLVSS